MEPFPLLRNGCLLTANISQRALLKQCKGLRKDAGQVLMYCQVEERGHAAQRAGCAPHWGLHYEIAVCPWTKRSPLALALGIGFFIYSVRGFFNVLLKVKYYCSIMAMHILAGRNRSLLPFLRWNVPFTLKLFLNMNVKVTSPSSETQHLSFVPYSIHSDYLILFKEYHRDSELFHQTERRCF